jgi:hypothetical protein
LTLKTRKELETTYQNLNLNTKTSSENNTKTLLSNILTPLSTTTKNIEAKDLKININSIKADFIKKYSV